MSADEELSVIDQMRSLGYADVTDAPVDPDEVAVAIHDEARMAPGYSAFSSAGRIHIVDTQGQVVKTWRDEHISWGYPRFLPDGEVLVVGSPVGLRRRGQWFLGRLRWDGSLAWQLELLVHHDMELTPDGRIAALISRRRRIPAIDASRRVVDDGIAIVSGDGELLEEYSLYDMLAASPDVLRLQEVRAGGPRGLDILHANALELMHHEHLRERDPIYASGNVLVTLRHQDRLVIIDLAQGRAVWAWGQGEVSGPHDAQVLESGNILLFDNGLERGWSRAIELDPLSKTIVWEWHADPPDAFFTASNGSAQRLPGGNTLLANSDNGEALEVTRDGEIVWRYRNFERNAWGKRVTLGRVKRLSREYVEGQLQRHE